jgi:DNA modification methylase
MIQTLLDDFFESDEDLKIKEEIKTYSQVLPMDTNKTVKRQFGWCPVSIFKPERREDLRQLIGDDGDESTRRSKDAKYLPGLRFSEFHPHLAEMCIKYWSMPNSLIVDPFAGRATRGIMALNLNRQYLGFEIAPNTFKKTSAKISPLGGKLINDNGCEMNEAVDNSADMVFTCPPYHRIEKYESTENQLSDITDYDEFLENIKLCASNIKRVLKPNGFLVWVCGDWRDGKAFRMFHNDSLNIFKEVGLIPWDVVIVHNNSPFAALQAGKVAAKRYTSKVHEYVLVFRKAGDILEIDEEL